MGKTTKHHTKKTHKKSKTEVKVCTSSSDSSSDEWVEKKTVRVRESWMSEPFHIPASSRIKEKTDAEKKAEEDIARMKDIQSQRELNPYWTGGGSGLPEKKDAFNEPRITSSGIGDHGVKWLYRALRRTEQQAKEEKRSLEEVAAERWGSLDNLKKMIKDAELKKSKIICDKPVESRYDGYSKPRFLKPQDQECDEKDGSSYARDDSSYHRKHHEAYSSDRRLDHHRRDDKKRGWRKKSDDKRIEEKKEPQKMEESRDKKGVKDILKSDSGNIVEEAFTDEQINSIASKILKAEIMGDQKTAKELSEKLERAKKLRSAVPELKPQDNVVILTKTNEQGFTQPLKKENQNTVEENKKKKKFETYHDGERVRYFEDDDKYSLKEMFEKEKMTSANDQNVEFLKILSKNKKVSKDDDELYMDQTEGESACSSSLSTDKAIGEHRRMERTLSNCIWCLNSKKLEKHLIISTTEKTYICVPGYKSLSPFHCLIVPIYHSTCSTFLDEDIWQEVKNLCKDIVKVFEKRDYELVFYEYAMNFRSYPHIVLHCVPVKKKDANLAPMYFKKAMSECERGSVNKKIVDIRNMDIKRAVPKGLPYFMVHFGVDFGYAHVIEDERHFPRNFAEEIFTGIMDLDPLEYHKRRQDDLEKQFEKVSRFKSVWKRAI